MNRPKSLSWTPVLFFVAALAGIVVVRQRYLRSAARQSGPVEAGMDHSPAPAAPPGATEEQIDHTMQHPPASALEAGESGVTGAAYELDPGSITPG